MSKVNLITKLSGLHSYIDLCVRGVSKYLQQIAVSSAEETKIAVTESKKIQIIESERIQILINEFEVAMRANFNDLEAQKVIEFFGTDAGHSFAKVFSEGHLYQTFEYAYRDLNQVLNHMHSSQGVVENVDV